jgi:hypothetical protein
MGKNKTCFGVESFCFAGAVSIAVLPVNKYPMPAKQCCGSGRFLSGSDFLTRLGLDLVPDPDPRPYKIGKNFFKQ